MTWRERVRRFDTRVETGFDRLRGNPVADRVFYGATALGDHGIIWLILGALRGLRSEHDWHAAVRVSAGVAAGSVVVNLGVKSLFRRTRPPWESERPLPLRRPRTSSFPSGHAASAMTGAVLLADDDVLWPVYYAIAGVVAASRVHVKIHHPSDVIGGLAVGYLMARVIRRRYPLPVRPAETVTGTE